MRRSKYGYLLLALLVITGLAGTITSTSITSKERKFAVNHFRDAKSDLLKSIKGLSSKQLEFKAGREKRSIKQCVFALSVAEKNYWELLGNAMKEPANPEKRSEIRIGDEQLINLIEDQNTALKFTESFASEKHSYKSVSEAIENFKALRAEHIKYIKSTTEDLRNHVVRMPFGWIDCYQVCLLIAANSNYQLQQIEKLKKARNFPSR